MRCTLDSIFKVGFGVELNCLEGTSKEGSEFMKAFDESNALVYWRYVDPFWKIKRYLNIGSEASLKNNVKFMDRFVHRLIATKRHNLEINQDQHVSLFAFKLFLKSTWKFFIIFSRFYLSHGSFYLLI